MTDVLVLSGADVRDLLPMLAGITLMRQTLTGLATGAFDQPLRSSFVPSDSAGLLGMMPAYRRGRSAAFGVKVISVFPDNPGRGLDSHLGVVIRFDGSDGQPTTIADASTITAIRTAAVSAVATDALARRDAGDLALVGAGVQARAHLEAISHVRALRRVRIAGRSPDRLDRVVDWARSRLACPVEAALSVEAAVDEADLVLTVTNARDPVLAGRWLRPGTHINAVGSSQRTHRELDGEAMARASLFVDRRESTESESGDFLQAVAEGAIGRDHIRAEIGEVLAGRASGRTSTDEITVFKSLGLAVEDLAAVDFVHAAAVASGRGTWVTL
jgi:ornithine cyclodeaminase